MQECVFIEYLFKCGLFSESFSLRLKSQKKVPNYCPEHYLPKVLFTDHYTWQNFCLRNLCIVITAQKSIYKTQNQQTNVLSYVMVCQQYFKEKGCDLAPVFIDLSQSEKLSKIKPPLALIQGYLPIYNFSHSYNQFTTNIPTCTMYYIRYILKYFLLGLIIHFLCKKYISTTKERKENKSKKLKVRNEKTK